MNNDNKVEMSNDIKTEVIGRINRFGERLRIAMNGEKNVSFAKRCDMSERVIRDYLAGRTYPSLDRLAIIAEASGKSIEWLATGNDINSERSSINNGNNIVVTEITNNKNPIQFILDKQWLSEVGLLNKELALIRVQGDSMSLTLNHNDIALIEVKSVWNNVLDGLFAISINNHIVVKRLQYDVIKNGYHVKNDNRKYDDFIDSISKLIIVGRVVSVLSNIL